MLCTDNGYRSEVNLNALAYHGHPGCHKVVLRQPRFGAVGGVRRLRTMLQRVGLIAYEPDPIAKTAKALGLTIPRSILQQVDDVIPWRCRPTMPCMRTRRTEGSCFASMFSARR